MSIENFKEECQNDLNEIYGNLWIDFTVLSLTVSVTQLIGFNYSF